jgi:mRNA-degrading endonuclease RelE of RelBE toxin-antitoxin system
MRYTVLFAKPAERQFDKLIRSDRRLGKRLATALDRISTDPGIGELLTGHWRGYHKYRVGGLPYRLSR